jgi:hypothetical protein
MVTDRTYCTPLEPAARRYWLSTMANRFVSATKTTLWPFLYPKGTAPGRLPGVMFGRRL